MDAGEIYQSIINIIGLHGVFAVLGAIAVLRMIRAGLWLSKKQSFIAAPIVAGLLGSGAVYFIADINAIKPILGGAFINIIATMIAYDVIKITLVLLYQWTKWKAFNFIYFFISPKPMKIKNGHGEKEIIIPPDTLTKFMDFRKVDFDPTKK